MNPDDVRAGWAELTGEYSPPYYAYYGPDERSDAVESAMGDHLGATAAVCELGCSAGRHLAHLREKGYTNLSGVDLNQAAFDVLAETYPDLYRSGTFYEGALADVLPEFDEDAFDGVYSVETLQHIHPDAAEVFDEIVRITESVLVTVEIESRPNEKTTTTNTSAAQEDPPKDVITENVPLYYRNWRSIFEDRGLRQVSETETDRDVVRTFVPDKEWITRGNTASTDTAR